MGEGMEPSMPSSLPAVVLLSDPASPQGLQAGVLLADVLEESGYQLLRAAEGEAAEALLAPSRAVALLMELEPGDAAALALLRRLSALTAVLVISRQHDPAWIVRLRDAGAVDCLSKPLRLSLLLERLARWARAPQEGTPPRAGAGLVQPSAVAASMTVRERDGHCAWQSAQARAWTARYFPPPFARQARLPPDLLLWLHREALRRRAGAMAAAITIAPWGGAQGPRLSLSLHEAEPRLIGEGHWLVLMHEASDAARVARLARALHLEPAQAELLFACMGGADEAQLRAALGLSANGLAQRLAALCEALGVATPVQAVARGQAVLRQA